MKPKDFRLHMVFLVCTGLVVSSCAPSIQTTADGTVTASSTIPAVATTKADEEPQYCGTLMPLSVLDMGIFDPIAPGAVHGHARPTRR